MQQYQLPIFQNLCPSWQNVTYLGNRRTFPKGYQILDLETQLNGIYLVMEGSVEVILYTLRGPEKVLFYVGSGCIFGEVSCFVSGDRDDASVRARSDCILYFFSRDVLEGTIASQYPHLLIEMIQATSYKLRMYSVLLRDSLSSNPFLHVCKMLVYLVRFKGIELPQGQKQVVIQPEMTQNDIAKLMGVHRVTVTKAIGQLKEMGIVRYFSKHLLDISDFPALCQLIEKDDWNTLTRFP